MSEILTPLIDQIREYSNKEDLDYNDYFSYILNNGDLYDSVKWKTLILFFLQEEKENEIEEFTNGLSKVLSYLNSELNNQERRNCEKVLYPIFCGLFYSEQNLWDYSTLKPLIRFLSLYFRSYLIGRNERSLIDFLNDLINEYVKQISFDQLQIKMGNIRFSASDVFNDISFIKELKNANRKKIQFLKTVCQTIEKIGQSYVSSFFEKITSNNIDSYYNDIWDCMVNNLDFSKLINTPTAPAKVTAIVLQEEQEEETGIPPGLMNCITGKYLRRLFCILMKMYPL